MWIAARGMALSASCALAFGCVSEQLNYNTLHIDAAAAAVDSGDPADAISALQALPAPTAS
jgi:hypothetical protein